MLKNLSIAKKIGAGFTIILVLLGVVAIYSFVGISGIVSNAGEVIDGNMLRGEMVQREVDHLNWANQVAALLTDNEVTELDVQLDPHKCAFGMWYYGDGRQRAEELVPEMKSYLAEIEEPHAHLHESAGDIGKVFVQADLELGNFLREKKTDHLAWTHKVKDAFLHDQTTIDVEVDPNQCALGKWMNSAEVAELKREYPQFAAVLAEVDAPHRKLHESAVRIQELLAAGQRQEASQYYLETTEPAAHHTLEAIDKVMAWDGRQVQGMQEANSIFAGKTKPALEEVQKLLGQINSTVAKSVMTDEEMLRAASQTQTVVTVLSIVGAIVGIMLAIFITRGIVTVLKRIISALTQGADQVSTASGQVSSSSQQMAEGASEQASSLEETSASLQEMGSMSRQNADNAKEANNLSGGAATEAEKGNEAMSRMSQAIDNIKKSSDQTAKIIKTIDEIAFQTNLLALNAAVEAARAGEAGKGFAVVAEEVRNLAQRSAEAARNTNDLIEGSQKNADVGVQVAQEVAESLGAIVDGARKVTGLIGEISAASDEQAKGVEQINQGMTQMDKVTQENAANAEESASASEELNAQAEELKVVVGELQTIVSGRAASAEAGVAARTHETAWDKKEVRRANKAPGLGKIHGMKDRIHALAHKGEAYANDEPRNIKRTAGQGKPEELIPLEEGDFKDAETAAKA